MKELPGNLTAYRRTPVFSCETVPRGLLRDHKTRAGTWGRIHVLAGSVRYHVPDRAKPIVLTSARPGIIPPEMPHRVELSPDASFFVEFWR